MHINSNFNNIPDDSSEYYKPYRQDIISNSLDFSNEIYFGKDAPLGMILRTYSKKIKDLIGAKTDKHNFKDKKFVNQIKNLTDEFGAKISEELNVERTDIVIVLDKEINAFCIPLNTCFDNRFVEKDGTINNKDIDLDIYADLENIIQTKTGYKFKNPKNKFLFITINIGLIWEFEAEGIAAILCHELGHCFQHAIFGSYKNYSDLMYMRDIKRLGNRFDTFFKIPNSPFGKIIKVFGPGIQFSLRMLSGLLVYFLNPSFLNNNIFTKFNLFLHKKFFNRIVDEKRFMISDKIKKLDKDELSTKERNQMANLTYINDIDRKKEFEKDKKEVYDNYKKINIYKEEVETKSKCKRYVQDLINAIAFDFDNKGINFLNFISLSRFAQNSYQKQIFYKKYEYFADIFASSYGFSPILFKKLSQSELDDDRYLKNDVFNKFLYKIPMFKAAALLNSYQRIRDYEIIDEHGGAFERGSAMYTNLINELKTNKDLTKSQIESIKADIDLMKNIDESYIKERKINGISFIIYNNYIKKRRISQDKRVEELILEPLIEVANQK